MGRDQMYCLVLRAANKFGGGFLFEQLLTMSYVILPMLGYYLKWNIRTVKKSVCVCVCVWQGVQRWKFYTVGNTVHTNPFTSCFTENSEIPTEMKFTNSIKQINKLRARN